MTSRSDAFSLTDLMPRRMTAYQQAELRRIEREIEKLEKKLRALRKRRNLLLHKPDEGNEQHLPDA